MQPLLKILELSFLLLALLGYGYSVSTWFPIWRKRGSGSAHAFFLITGTLLIICLVEIVALIGLWIDGCSASYAHAELVAAFLFVNSFFNVALARGYFRMKKE